MGMRKWERTSESRGERSISLFAVSEFSPAKQSQATIYTADSAVRATPAPKLTRCIHQIPKFNPAKCTAFTRVLSESKIDLTQRVIPDKIGPHGPHSSQVPPPNHNLVVMRSGSMLRDGCEGRKEKRDERPERRTTTIKVQSS